MKRRTMFLLAAVLLAWGISGCAGKESDPETYESVESETRSEKSTMEREWKSAKKQSNRKPVLGVDNDSYEGFQYLAPYKLESDNYKAVVYLPEDEYAATQDGRALAEKNGVWVTVLLEPLLRSSTADGTLEEKLQAYAEIDREIYEDSDSRKEFEMSEVRVLDDNKVEVEYSYADYNPYTEIFASHWGVYYLTETDDGRTFFITIEVNQEGVTEQTEEVLEELGEYLQIELEYDREAMFAKAAKYEEEESQEEENQEEENSEEENGNMVSTDFWTFELPEGWEENRALSSDDEHVYAPNGSLRSGSVVYVSEENIGQDVSYVKELDDDMLVQLFEVMLGDELDISDINVVGDTAVGYAVKIEFEERGVNLVTYVIFEERSAYMIMALEDGSGTEAFEAAEHILNTAKAK